MSTTEITERRQIKISVDRTGGVQWTVNVFNHGLNYMLIATSPGIQFQAHFDAEQWAEFQKLVSP